MQTHELEIATDTQASVDDVEVVMEAFAEYFHVSVARDIFCPPGSVRPMVLSFSIDPCAEPEYYDALKTGIRRLLSLGSSRIARRFYVQAMHWRGTLCVSSDHIQIRREAGYSEYTTLDDPFREIQQD